jgi:DNA methylase
MSQRVPSQPQLFPEAGKPPRAANTTVFLDNMALPVHRWFRYSAGFSATWVEEVVRSHGDPRSINVFDPFVGSGTTCIAAQAVGAHSVGLESHPFVARLARAKLCWTADPAAFLKKAGDVLGAAQPAADLGSVAPLLQKCFPPESLAKLRSIRDGIDKLDGAEPVDELLWLALVAILRQCSPVGTAQWQYVLPSRRKARTAEPYAAFRAQVELMAQDMRYLQERVDPGPCRVVTGDARESAEVPASWGHLLITSPPYPNNYDYADATRVEMTFLGEIQGWGDLQDKVRRFLVRSCSQHMTRAYDAEADLESEPLGPIAPELQPVYRSLSELRVVRAGHKAYDSMVVAYFRDLAEVWRSLRRVMAPRSTVCFVVGDSAPYGVHVPVERWLGELAVAAGFRSYRFEKLRDRNVKWKNRKHRIPLHEGRLWVEG